jgi:hypothetical protein
MYSMIRSQIERYVRYGMTKWPSRYESMRLIHLSYDVVGRHKYGFVQKGIFMEMMKKNDMYGFRSNMMTCQRRNKSFYFSKVEEKIPAGFEKFFKHFNWNLNNPTNKRTDNPNMNGNTNDVMKMDKFLNFFFL